MHGQISLRSFPCRMAPDPDRWASDKHRSTVVGVIYLRRCMPVTCRSFSRVHELCLCYSAAENVLYPFALGTSYYVVLHVSSAECSALQVASGYILGCVSSSTSVMIWLHCVLWFLPAGQPRGTGEVTPQTSRCAVCPSYFPIVIGVLGVAMFYGTHHQCAFFEVGNFYFKQKPLPIMTNSWWRSLTLGETGSDSGFNPPYRLCCLGFSLGFPAGIPGICRHSPPWGRPRSYY